MITTPKRHSTSDPPAARPPGPAPRHDLALLPLRAFLGITYVFAGLQKLASTTYLDPRARAGVVAQMQAAAHTSPIGGLLGTATRHAAIVGIVIAFGELAVGIGTLLGLWTRVAAVGGMVLALSFLLAVSWHSDPYYLGPDIVFLVAFTPFVLAPPSRWSVDALVARRLHLEPAPRSAAMPDEQRRRFLETLTIAGWVGLVGLAAGGSAAALGRLAGDRHRGSSSGAVKLQPPPTTPTEIAPGGTATTAALGAPIGRASDVPVGGSALFTDPASGGDAIVVQPEAGVFEACSAVCTHEGCTLEYRGTVLHCPCHGAEFNPRTGAVLQGPARQPLATLTIRSASDGTLSVSS